MKNSFDLYKKAMRTKHAEKHEVEEEYREIFARNASWAASQPRSFFREMSRGQTPDYLYIGCSDSRVNPNEITGLTLGEMFVHRNIANVVDPTDPNIQAVINYAVGSLGVKHVFVCGHMQCGGVAGSLQDVKLPVVSSWLQQIREVYRLNRAKIDAIADLAEKTKALVVLNVCEQVRNVLKNQLVLQSYRKTGYPKVHGWVFSLERGELIDLKINSAKIIEELLAITAIDAQG